MSEKRRTPRKIKQYVDLDTGECLNAMAEVPHALKYAMPGGYGVVSLVYVSRMLKMKLGAGLEVALYLMSQTDYGGMCMTKNGDVARELGMTPTYVCTLIGKLHRAGVLHKVGPRTVFMNPAFLFRGSAQEQHRALERWSMYRRELMGVVSEEDAA